MKILLLALSLCVVSGCTFVEMTHNPGERPELEIPRLKEFCNDKVRVKDQQGGIVFTCQRKL